MYNTCGYIILMSGEVVQSLALQHRMPGLALRVQVANKHVLTQNLYYNYYYPNPKYLIIGYMDPKP